MTKTLIRGTMIDSETLSLGGNALPWEVAAVRFSVDISGDAPVIETHLKMNALIDYSDMSTRGFDIDLSTINWTNRTRAADPEWSFWRSSNLEGKNPQPTKNILLLKPSALWRELDWICGGSEPVFFRNSAFDVPVLSNLFRMAGLGENAPWHRRRQSDVYSFVNMAAQLHGYEDVLPKSTGHRALDDCLGQIGQLAEVMRIIHNGAPAPEADRLDGPS